MQASPAHVYGFLASNKGFQDFSPYKDADPNLKITLSGPEHGVGSSFAFEGKDGKGTQTIVALDQNRSVTMQIDLGSMGTPVQTFNLIPGAGSTTVVWQVQASFSMNPVKRVFGLFMDSMMVSTIERGLSNLSRVANQAA